MSKPYLPPIDLMVKELGPTLVLDLALAALEAPTWADHSTEMWDAAAVVIRRALDAGPATPAQLERARALFNDKSASPAAREVALVVDPEMLKSATPLERVTLIGAITRPALDAIQEGDRVAPLALAALYATTPSERRVDYVQHLAAYAVKKGDMSILQPVQAAIAGGCDLAAGDFAAQLIQVCMTRLCTPTPAWAIQAISEQGH